MRFLFALIIVIMALAIIVFAFNNQGTTVPVTLVNTHPDLPLITVVIVAITFGVVFVGIVAMIEGAKTRFENLRLRREAHKLETELNFLRTEPGTRQSPTAEAALPPPDAEPEAVPSAGAPTAPVYEADRRKGDGDPDDDMYAGGRAV